MTDVTSGDIHDASVGDAASSRKTHFLTDEERQAIMRSIQRYVAEENSNGDKNSWLRS